MLAPNRLRRSSTRRASLSACFGSCLLWALLLGALPAPASAQRASEDHAPAARTPLPSEHQQFYLATNVLLGGARAGLEAWHAGRPIRPALLKGVVGGLVMYGGVRLSGSREIPGVVGNQLVAVGGAIARSAGDGTPFLSDVILPFYPVLVRVRRGAAQPVQIRLSALATGYLAYWAVQPRHDTGVDWRASLRNGTVVLRSDATDVWAGRQPSVICAGATCPRGHSGVARYGAVLVGTVDRGGAYDRRILAHEQVHVAQHTRDLALYGVGSSEWLLSRTGGLGRTLARVMVLDLVQPVGAASWGTRLFAQDSYDNFYEREAEFMTGRTHCDHYPGAGCRW